MLRTSSLRINNVILDEDYQPFLIESEAELIAIKEVPERFNPLEITEYRLREMGFKVTCGPNQLDMYTMELPVFPELTVTVNPVWTRKKFCFSIPGDKMIPIKYVHQLQNLIYDYTGHQVSVGLDKMP